MRHVQATQQITWQSHHRNPGRKVRFISSLVLLTIKVDCTLPTDCPNALVYADLLVGSLSTPSPTTLCHCPPFQDAEPANISVGREDIKV